MDDSIDNKDENEIEIDDCVEEIVAQYQQKSFECNEIHTTFEDKEDESCDNIAQMKDNNTLSSLNSNDGNQNQPNIKESRSQPVIIDCNDLIEKLLTQTSSYDSQNNIC
jgi:hypothetical protein